MQITYPEYFQQFHCLAGACPDSCCKEWAVSVDEESAEKYRRLSGALGDALRSAMTEEDGDTILALTPDGRCPMWRRDGLCRIQAELGEEGLCHTCAQFPRLRHDYGSFVELGLELSCPEAARLILSASGTATVCVHTPETGHGQYDPEAMHILLHSREEVLSFLGEEGFSVGEALAVILLYGYAVQNQLDGGEPAVLSPAADLARAKNLARPGQMDDILTFFLELEILTPRWRQRLTSPEGSHWSRPLGAVARYLVERYWLQAVSDYDLVGRVKFMIVSCLVVKTLGGEITQTAQLYSKEIENDADNVDSILDGAYTSPALADVKLLGLLLSE